MITIHKYPLTLKPVQEIKMPAGAKILDIQVQQDVPCMWVLNDTSHTVESRYFEVFATGEPLTTDEHKRAQYIATFQIYSGAYVYHVFEVKK